MGAGGPLNFGDVQSPPLPAQQRIQGGGELFSFGGQPFWLDSAGTTWALTSVGINSVSWAQSGGVVPQTQTQPVSGGGVGVSTQTFQFQPAGTTDTLGPYSDIYSTQVYGTSPAITETVQISGYNLPTSYGASNYRSAAGSVYTYIHPDAGDTNVGGAYGLEWGVAVAGPNFGWQVNAIQVIAVDDADQSVETIFRYSSGTSDATKNVMVFQNAKTNTVDMKFGLGTQGETVSSQATYWLWNPPASTGKTLLLQVASPDQGVQLWLSGATGALGSVIYFQAGGVNKWTMGNGSASNIFSLNDTSSGNYPMYIQPVASDVPLFRTQSTFRVETGSLIVGLAAIATNATRGFLYLPSCAGAPTGTPVTQTGTAACVFDTTDSKIYVYSGGWKSVAVS